MTGQTAHALVFDTLLSFQGTDALPPTKSPTSSVGAFHRVRY
jgi:hypothetical protein